MKTIAYAAHLALVLSFGALFASAPAFADKPSWAGKGKGNDDRDDDRKGGKHDGGKKHFKDKDRAYIHDYYSGEFNRGHCPPGLAKKHNGCMPPGQAKKWAYGRPLPRDVVFYEVPQPVVVRIGPPPSGYKYVRVASDILMIAVGTNMVVDAIQDLGRM
jgi:Ni/Co efflux regulator RcnB